jgi:alkylation response protein AidB-like acyl-CoA dehydrogenase
MAMLIQNTTTTGTIAQRMLADIADLAPDIARRAAEFEAGRHMPADVVEMLRTIGVFRMLSPRSHGGLEFELPVAVEILRALSRIDGALGWTAMIGSGGSVFAPLLSRARYNEIYEDGPDAILGGSAQPAGKAEKVPGGWRVTGRWPFASGCLHADWLFAFCVMMENGAPIADAGGLPMVRGFGLPADEWLIEDTWHVAGLKGTGSHHIALQDRFIPADEFFDLMATQPCEPGPLYTAVLPVLPLLHGAFAVGMAEGALDELAAMAQDGRQQFRAAVPMRDSETFQYELGRVAADARAARAFHDAQVAASWRHALAGTLRDDARYVENTQMAIWLAGTAVRVADACFALGGGAAVYEASPLQRRMRDMHAAAQHAAAQQRRYVDCGKLLLKDAGVPVGRAA